jgi:hypothetical protein
LAKFYRSKEPNLKDTTINWRIYELVKNGVLERIGRGKFKIGQTKSFEAIPSKQITKLYKDLQGKFPFLQICIWETGWLNEFAQHLSNKPLIIVETEKDACESVFYKLQDTHRSVYLNPSEDLMTRYASVESKPIIVKSLVSESPIQEVKGINLPTLEKILVDLYSDKDVFYAYQGSELKHIWENAFRKYTIQQDKLLRYADRRRKKEEIKTYIKNL